MELLKVVFIFFVFAINVLVTISLAYARRYATPELLWTVKDCLLRWWLVLAVNISVYYLIFIWS